MIARLSAHSHVAVGGPAGIEARGAIPEPMSAAPTPSRIAAIDHAKAIGIVLVVFGHCWRGLIESGIIHRSGGYGLIDSWVYAFHMPLFFVLSGLFIPRAVARPMSRVLKGKLATLAYPYLIWSVLQAVITAPFASHLNHPQPLSDLPRILLVQPYSPFWFLYVLFFCEILYVALRKARLSPVLILAMAAIAFWWYRELLPWRPVHQFANFFVYFVLGAIVSPKLLTLAIRPSPGFVPLAVVGGLLLTALVLWTNVLHPLFAFPAAVGGMVMAFGVAFSLSLVSAATVVGFLGRYSLHIYLMHILCASGFRVVLHRVAHVQDPWIHLAGGMVCGLAGPILFWMATRRFGGQWLFRFPLGSASNWRPVC